jgi:hypothetical protein
VTRELAATQQEVEQLKEELQIKKCRSTNLDRRLNKCKYEPETTENKDIAQLQWEKDILLHQVKNLSSEKSGLATELRVFEHVIQ